MKECIIAVDVEGVGTYEVELLSRTAESAARRAKFAIAGKYHRQMDLDKITTRVLEEKEFVRE